MVKASPTSVLTRTAWTGLDLVSGTNVVASYSLGRSFPAQILYQKRPLLVDCRTIYGFKEIKATSIHGDYKSVRHE